MISSDPHPIIHENINLIVERANSCQEGVYWNTGNQSKIDSILSFSIGDGNAGILLTLLDYYKLSLDSSIKELLLQGAEWLSTQTRKFPPHNGFYRGSGGVWFLFNEIERVFPDVCGSWKKNMEDFFAKNDSVSSGLANINSGICGTIITVLSLMDSDHELFDKVLQRCVESLLISIKLSDSGLYWDFTNTSTAPLVGFLYGVAGVDYTLAHLQQFHSKTFSRIIGASLNFSREFFCDREGTWENSDLGNYFNIPNEMQVHRLMLKGDLEALLSLHSDESLRYPLGWSSGLSGIIESRDIVEQVYKADRIAEVAREDIVRAEEFIKCVEINHNEINDYSIISGLSGMALTLPRHIRSECKEIDRFTDKISSRINTKRAQINNENLSFFTGVAGLCYAQMGLANNPQGKNVLDPLSFGVPVDDDKEDQSIDLFTQKNLKYTSSILDLTEPLKMNPISLALVRNLTEPLTKKKENEIQKILLSMRFLYSTYWLDVIPTSYTGQKTLII